jgi:hypothetical protein
VAGLLQRGTRRCVARPRHQQQDPGLVAGHLEPSARVQSEPGFSQSTIPRLRRRPPPPPQTHTHTTHTQPTWCMTAASPMQKTVPLVPLTRKWWSTTSPVREFCTSSRPRCSCSLSARTWGRGGGGDGGCEGPRTCGMRTCAGLQGFLRQTRAAGRPTGLRMRGCAVATPAAAGLPGNSLPPAQRSAAGPPAGAWRCRWPRRRCRRAPSPPGGCRCASQSARRPPRFAPWDQ